MIASDGLIARESGEWASDKLFYVARYMDIFTGGMRDKWPRRAYIDLMSGPGLCIVPPTGREFDGSPVLALKTTNPFTDVILVEADAQLADALEQRTARDSLRPTPTILRGDCNSANVIAEIRNRVSTGTLSLMFIDLLGMNVTMETIRAISHRLPMDLIITFPEMDVVRNWQAARALDSEHAPRFDAFFGTHAWTDAVDKTKPGDRQADSLIRFYARQLEHLDYKSSVLPLTMKNTKGGTLYRPIFASRHDRGIDFWEKISSKRDPSGQGRLL